MSARTRWLIAGAVLLLLLAGGVAVLTPGADDTPADSVEGTAESHEDSPDAPEAGFPSESSGVSATTASLTGTTASTSARRAVSVKDTPAPALTDEEKWQLYLEQTRAMVETDPGALQAMAEKILEALNAGDEGALAEYLPDDEGAQAEYVGYIADRYPTILETEPGGTVNVFSSGDATVYIAYAIVIWEDAGLVSEHTIPIPMRFVDGQWQFTSVEYWSDSLTFVQSVRL